MLAKGFKGVTFAKINIQVNAYLVILVGSVVILGWYIRAPSLIQIHQAFVPMQYNTALGFLISGIGIVSVIYHKVILARLCSGFVLILGALTLAEYILGVNLSIDQLLMEHYITVKTSHPGRMAPNTALCFTLTGLSLQLYLFYSYRYRLIWLSIIPATIFSLGTIAFLGYFSGVESLYGWGKLTRMALHTAISFILIGVGLLSLAWVESKQNNTPSSHWLSYAIGACLILLTLLTWQGVRANEFKKNHTIALKEAELFATNLQANLNSLSSALHRMNKRFSVTGQGYDWYSDISQYLSDFPHLLAVKPYKQNLVRQSRFNIEVDDYSNLNPERQNFLPNDNKTSSISQPILTKNFGFLTWYIIRSPNSPETLLALIDYRTLVNLSLKQTHTENRFTLSLTMAGMPLYNGLNLKADHNGLVSEKLLYLDGQAINLQTFSDIEGIAEEASPIPTLIMTLGGIFSILILWLLNFFKEATEKQQLLAFNRQLQQEIEEKEQAQLALTATNELLLSSNRDLEQFAFIASHDLKEPLRKVQAFGNLLVDEYSSKLDDNGRYYIKTMQNAAERMSILISDLLKFSRVSTQGGAFEPCDPELIIRDTLSTLAFQLKKSEVKVSIEKLPLVYADPAQLSQLFQNLISNGIKFRNPSVPAKIIIHANKTRDYWQILVEDNGIGFEQQYAKKIFQIFQRLHAKNKIPGTGIGLAICRRIMERHGGTIKADSVAGQGSCFTLSFPRHQQSQEPNGENEPY